MVFNLARNSFFVEARKGSDHFLLFYPDTAAGRLAAKPPCGPGCWTANWTSTVVTRSGFGRQSTQASSAEGLTVATKAASTAR